MPFSIDTRYLHLGPVFADRFRSVASRSPAALDWLRDVKTRGHLPLLHLPDRSDDLVIPARIAERFRRDFDHVLVLGTGGSSLGGKTLVQLVDRGFGPAKGTPKLHFLDNVDPTTYEDFFAATAGSRVGVIAISKSGSTAETLSQLLTVIGRRMSREMMADGQMDPPLPTGTEDATRNPSHWLVAITEPTDNPLRRLANRLGATVLEHDPKVGGRFSVLSLVGLLPAMVAGVDAAAVRAGAKQILDRALAAKTAEDCPAMTGAVWNVTGEEGRANATVLMPYVDRLSEFGLWFRQLWAESLGKQSKGIVPIRAMGTVDQHSQVQLYLGGPNDKLYTVIMEPTRGKGDVLTNGEDSRLDYLAGRTMGDLLDAEARATYETLARNQRPSRLITLSKPVDAHGLGALMMHFMLETMLAARLMGVDAFDQPAVEEGKVLTRAYLKEMAGA
jgi:glucose-6-phosphate isomerase